jgi:type IV pilus biogenesis protein CpaD/CtpE
MNVQTRIHFIAVCVIFAALLNACTPTVKVETDKPITINLNVNIQHEIRVKVDKELDSVLSKDSGLF